MTSSPPTSTEGAAPARPLADRWKDLRRRARFHLVACLSTWIQRQPVTAIPRLRRLLLKVFPLVFHREARRAAELLPAEFAGRREEILRGMAVNQVMNLLEIMFYEKLLAARPDYVRLEGTAILERARQEGRGSIILSGHFGNWELTAYSLVRAGVPLHVIARPQAINQMTEFMNGFRQRRGVKVLMANNLSESLKILHQGLTVGIVSDLDARERGYRVPFFGRDASFYPTPVILSVRGNAPLIPVFGERQPDGSHVVRVGEPVAWERGESMTDRVRKYAACYEEAIRRRPDLWVWFHERYAFAHLGRAA
ncbi:MAG: lysophospholipid acyltransferase family protein [Candidatus Riflebacteria bacterium]|nr:lysophospholipid acyltransferase family protein [Candidatus Riflebacteria bacterium]